MDGAVLTGNVVVANQGHVTLLNEVYVVNLQNDRMTLDGSGSLNIAGLFVARDRENWSGGGDVHILEGAVLDLRPRNTTVGTFNMGKNLINDGTVKWTRKAT